MKLALQITSWIAVVLGALAILGGTSETGQQALDSFLGGAMFLGQAVLALAYIQFKEKSND